MMTTLLRKLMNGNVGFSIEETMSGTQVFEPGMGPEGELPFSFTVTWGPSNLKEWGDPRGENFLVQPLCGTVTAEGLCGATPCEGTLSLRYFRNYSIRYEFTFEQSGVHYRYVGEKVNIKPWNLPVSHTTCFGTLTQRDSGQLVARSVTHFRLATALDFVASFRPKF